MRIHSIEDASSTKLSDLVNYPKEKESRMTFHLFFTAAISVFSGGYHFGFLISIINPMADVLQSFLMKSFESRYSISLNQSQLSFIWSSIAGSLFIGAALGASFMSFYLERKGPRSGVLVSALLLGICTPLAGLSYHINSPELFVISRLLSGFGIGMGTTAHGVYLTEISPVRHRGIIGCLGGLSTNIGFIFAGALGLPTVFGDQHHWFIPFFIQSIPCYIVLAVGVFLHDSPLFLLKSGRTDDCNKAIEAFCGKDEVDKELNRIKFEKKADQCELSTWTDILQNLSTRRALLLAVILNITVAFSGILAVSFFGTLLLHAIGFSDSAAALANCLSALSGTVGAILGAIVVDRIGRRILIMTSLLLLAVINTLFMILVYTYQETGKLWIGWAFLILFICFLFIFSAGIGPLAWFLGAELAPVGARPKLQSASVSAQYISCFISPICYYPMSRNFGPISFLVFIIPLSAAAVYFYHFLPESKGKTTEEIGQMLSKENTKLEIS